MGKKSRKIKNEAKKTGDDVPLGKKVAGSFEVKSFTFILRLSLYFGFAFMMFTNIRNAWTWCEVMWVQKDPPTQMEPLIKQAVKTGHFDGVYQWVSYRAPEESADILKKLEPYSAKLTPPFFVHFARRAEYLKDMDKARFWMMLARFRYQFDALRCGAPDAVKIMNTQMATMALVTRGRYAPTTPQQAVKLGHDVLAFDEKYPAANNPDDSCRAVYMMQGMGYTKPPERIWPAVRKNLRFATAFSIDDSERELKNKPVDLTPPRGKE